MRVNFDSNATFGVLPEVAEMLSDIMMFSGNPSSIHQDGQRARMQLEGARSKLRSAVMSPGARHELVFTSGATEANNCALSCPFSELTHRQNGEEGASLQDSKVIISCIEHPSVREMANRLSELGCAVATIGLSESGDLDLEQLKKEIDDRTVLVSIMLANNETGQVFDVAAVSRLVRECSSTALVHTDAVQAFGKCPVNFDELDVDLMSLTAHKAGGLTGIGALILHERLSPVSFQIGGSQEGRFRAGTENVMGIASFGKAASHIESGLKERMEAMESARDSIQAALQEAFPDSVVIGASQPRLPNTLSIRLPGVYSDDLVVAADLQGVSISGGAACSSGKPLPSHVLTAMGLSAIEAKECIRISVRHDHSSEEVAFGIETLISCISKMKQSKENVIPKKKDAATA